MFGEFANSIVRGYHSCSKHNYTGFGEACPICREIKQVREFYDVAVRQAGKDMKRIRKLIEEQRKDLAEIKTRYMI